MKYVNIQHSKIAEYFVKEITERLLLRFCLFFLNRGKRKVGQDQQFT